MSTPSGNPGFYVAHHRWFDADDGPDALYKVGFTSNLGRRLTDDAYTTCFPEGFRFVAVVTTANGESAHRLETGVLHCASARRVVRANGVQSELVRMPRRDIVELAKAVADTLEIPITLVEDPDEIARLCKAGPPAANRKQAAQNLSASPATLPPAELGKLAGLVVSNVPAVVGGGDDIDDFIDELIDGIEEMSIAGGNEVSLPPAMVDAPPPKKTMEDYLREAREAVAAERMISSVDDDVDDIEMVDMLLADENIVSEYDNLVLEPRGYQADAIAACVDELKRNKRAMLQMACRCGKTPVAYGAIRHYIAASPESARVLFLVPGLALMRQTALKLDRYGFAGTNTRLLLVGSDDRPIDRLNTLSGGSAAGTTDPDYIAEVCAAGSGPLLVVSTYQSSELLPDGFDLIVFDESHRICGDSRPRPFNHVLLTHAHGDRLFMTATPRYDGALSMKNRELFGGVAYAYHMRQGIDAGYVNPFSLEIVGRTPTPDNPKEASADQIAAAFNSLEGAGKLLVFCRSIRHASDLCEEVSGLVDDEVACLTAHSRMSRADIQAGLANFSAAGQKAILFNCRLFQEGVEIPALNGVFFASPRHSPRDIIQSLCRPLNIMPGKPMSKVFVPVTYNPAESVDSAANLERFASIIPVFDALLAEDPLLFEHILDPRGTPYPLRWVQSQAKGMAVARYDPDQLIAAARRSIRRGGAGKTERLLRASRIPWEIGFAELKRIVVDCRRYPKGTDAYMYGDAKVNFGLFYKYARDNYSKWLAGEAQPLEPHQLRDLESLPHWTTLGLDGPYPWKETLDFLDQWLRDHNGVPPMVEINKGGFVGLSATMMERLSGTLTCINQSDGRDRKARDGSRKLGSGMTLEASKQADLDELCARWNLRWRKERTEPPEDAPPGAVGSLVENDKGEYIGERTFIQEAFARFKHEWSTQGTRSEYIQTWFKDYPHKHAHQEELDVWERRKEGVTPPRWRGRGRTAKTPFDAKMSMFM